MIGIAGKQIIPIVKQIGWSGDGGLVAKNSIDLDRDPSAVLYFPGYPYTGNTINDRSGSSPAKNGTISGATWTRLSSGRWALYFDGNDSVNCGTGLNLLNNFSLIAWVKRLNTTSANLTIISNYQSAGAGGYVFQIISTDSTLAFWTNGGGWKYSNTPILDTNWHFAVVTLDSSNNYAFFLDAIADGSGASGIANSSTQATLIGKQGTADNYWLGTIGGVWLFSKALTSAEITNIYLATRWMYR